MSRITLTAHRFTFFVILIVRPSALCYTVQTEQSCYRVAWPSFYIEWGVMLMDKKPFDFKDLIAFGMFILALLTFVFTFIK